MGRKKQTDIDALLRARIAKLVRGTDTRRASKKSTAAAAMTERARVVKLYPTIPEAVQQSAARFYAQMAPAVRGTLDGADASTVEAALEDYRAAVSGTGGPTARPEQMAAALAACRPWDALTVDKYGYFAAVYFRYMYYTNALREYRDRVKNEPDAEKRRDYFAAKRNARTFVELRASALYWLRYIGEMTAADFAGMEPEEIARALDFMDAGGAAYDFGQFVYILRKALNTPPELLEQLTPPALYESIAEALAYSDAIAAELDGVLRDIDAGVETAAKYAPAEDDGGKILIPRKIAALGSRDLFGTYDAKKDGDSPREILPIDAIIDDFCKRNPDALPVSPFVVQKAVEGVNLLHQFKRAQPVNGIYTYDTNLSEFAGLCMPKTDANDAEKKQLLTALLLFDGLWCVLWDAKKGPIAQRVFTVERFGRNELRLHLYASALHGRPYFIRASEVAQLTGKGKAAFHFRNQILVKGHKEEKTMVSEVFGYDSAAAMAQRSGDASQVAAVAEYQRKHRASDAKRLQTMFDKAAAAGLISYTREQNAAGEWVYKWTRTAPPTADEKAAADSEQ